MAAGVLLVEEAGGRVTDFFGAPLDFSRPTLDVVASNGHVHEAMLRVLELGHTGMRRASNPTP